MKIPVCVIAVVVFKSSSKRGTMGEARNNVVVQKGAIIPLIALLLASVLGVGGFMIDSLIMETTQQQCTVAAERSAMAGLKKLVELSQDASDVRPFHDKLVEAASWANTVAEQNETVGTSLGGEALGQIGLWYPSCGSASCPAQPGGKFIPGIWYVADDYDGSGTIDNGDLPASCTEFPCFVDYAPGQELLVNAAKVELGLASPIRLTFSKVIGATPTTVDGSAIAKIDSRQVTFLFDASTSAGLDSYKIANPPCDASAGDLGVECLNNLNLASYQYNHLSPGPAIRMSTIAAQFAFKAEDIPASCFEPYPNYWDQCSHLSATCRWCALEDTRPADPSTSPWTGTAFESFKYYKSDYDIDHTVKIYNEDGSYYNQDLKINRKIIEGSGPPSPMKEIMDGVHNVLKHLKAKSVPGDKFALAAFSEYMYPDGADTRIFTFTANPDPLILATDTSLSLTDTLSNPGSWLNKGFFPTPGFTNGQHALETALRWYTQDLGTHAPAQRAIFTFTDGFFNCVKSPQLYGGARYCNAVLPHVMRHSFETIGNELSPQLLNNKILWHSFVFGQSRPHTINWKHPDRTGEICMTLEEMRAAKIPYTHGWMGGDHAWYAEKYFESVLGHFTVPRPTHFLREALEVTGGIMYPIRKACNCGSNPLRIKPECTGLPRICDLTYEEMKDNIWQMPRQQCDVDDRTILQQMLDAFDKLLEPPIMLVQ